MTSFCIVDAQSVKNTDTAENKAYLKNVQNVLIDGSYTGKKFANKVNDILGATVEVLRRNELHKFVVLPKRWIVER